MQWKPSSLWLAWKAYLFRHRTMKVKLVSRILLLFILISSGRTQFPGQINFCIGSLLPVVSRNLLVSCLDCQVTLRWPWSVLTISSRATSFGSHPLVRLLSELGSKNQTEVYFSELGARREADIPKLPPGRSRPSFTPEACRGLCLRGRTLTLDLEDSPQVQGSNLALLLWCDDFHR